MARRNSAKRKGPESRRRHLKRQENTRNQLKLVIIACEGTKTEPAYFKKLFDQLKQKHRLSRESCVIALHRHTDPPGVLQDLLNYETPWGFTYKDYDQRWIVIDRDPERTNGGGHRKEAFNEVIARGTANKPKIDIAWSNPCFEIWFLLHYEYRNTAIDRDDVYQRMNRLLGKPYNKADGEIYTLLECRLPTAVKNATRLQEDASMRGVLPADTNPGTAVHTLVTQLLAM